MSLRYQSSCSCFSYMFTNDILTAYPNSHKRSNSEAKCCVHKIGGNYRAERDHLRGEVGGRGGAVGRAAGAGGCAARALRPRQERYHWDQVLRHAARGCAGECYTLVLGDNRAERDHLRRKVGGRGGAVGNAARSLWPRQERDITEISFATPPEAVRVSVTLYNGVDSRVERDYLRREEGGWGSVKKKVHLWQEKNIVANIFR